MSLADKVAQLNAVISQEAAELGLVFVNGCDPTPWTPPIADIGHNNGQARGVYLFAVAEK